MPFYEFECPQGHVTEKLVPMGTESVECELCSYPIIKPDRSITHHVEVAKRILSPTPTTFVCAGGRKL